MSLPSPLIRNIRSYLDSFLDDTHRITERGYEPSHDDIMRMLSRTMTTLGMKEYHFVMQVGTYGGYHLVSHGQPEITS